MTKRKTSPIVPLLLVITILSIAVLCFAFTTSLRTQKNKVANLENQLQTLNQKNEDCKNAIPTQESYIHTIIKPSELPITSPFFTSNDIVQDTYTVCDVPEKHIYFSNESSFAGHPISANFSRIKENDGLSTAVVHECQEGGCAYVPASSFIEDAKKITTAKSVEMYLSENDPNFYNIIMARVVFIQHVGDESFLVTLSVNDDEKEYQGQRRTPVTQSDKQRAKEELLRLANSLDTNSLDLK